MLTALRDALAPHYLIFKWVHLLVVAMWAFSTAVAYTHYVVPAFKAWLGDRSEPELIKRRDLAIRAFDRGVVLEHVAFPTILVSGLVMVWLNQAPLDQLSWLTVKLLIVALVFIPMEVVDYHISHFGGRKALSLQAEDLPRYERQVSFHWLFFRVTDKIVVVFVPVVFFLAVVKPF
ncbi:MAG: hypothetical protein KBC34_05905 [Phenylobacterium sp.]|nr:hypothetical protein [Phenylobacterium sp.]